MVQSKIKITTLIQCDTPQFIAQYAPAVGYEDVGIFVSQSGETKDVLNALEAAEKRGMACFGLANVVGSTLTKATSFCLPLCCGYEISVPATKTFTNQVVTFLYLAYRMAGLDATAGFDTPPGLDTGFAHSTNGDDLVVIPKSDAQISALLGVLPLQLLSYHMSVMRGFDPDFPRNLSKTLTVD